MRPFAVPSRLALSRPITQINYHHFHHRLHSAHRLYWPPHAHRVPTARHSFSNSSFAAAHNYPTSRFSLRDVPKEQLEDRTGAWWDRISAAARISLDGDEKWGWVAYRCAYAPELDARWETTKRRILQNLRKSIARSDAPSIVNTMDFIFVEDPALEGATNDQLRARFQTWAHANCAETYHKGIDTTRGSRYEYFLKVDGDLLREGNVGLVQGWPLEPYYEGHPEEEEEMDPEDWFKVRDDEITTNLYDSLHDHEHYYILYRSPEYRPAYIR
ncbi:uncharacterized protein F5Z01DRAFT_675491 [Emericellopsis atlantica]|uniref:Uncharacterized protein n=1 Tax=Emericellopsis atlantica TaxID=2614577 RepID=A0A9P8CPU2_9HYPO|nr:uncharacterized protein F5Z01DRAFT_675491 [Emericellopsis atlantica]KAG9253096.1 hypothetical protein F5Z01DRAFT_675491 [Emericellopsis atlantica]